MPAGASQRTGPERGPAPREAEREGRDITPENPENAAEAGASLPEELARWPAWAPDERQLADLELLLSGAFRPLTGFMSAAEAEAAAATGVLPDGTPWPFPVTLTVPADAVPADAGHLVLEDPERTPLAVLAITERFPAPQDGQVQLAGPVTALRQPEHGPFRRMRRSPEAVRAELWAGGSRNGTDARTEAPGTVPSGTIPSGTIPPATVPPGTVPPAALHAGRSIAAGGRGPGRDGSGAAREAEQRPIRRAPGSTEPPPGRDGRPSGEKPRVVLGCVTRRPLHRRQLGQLRHLADDMKARLLLIPAVAGRAEVVERPEALVRAVLAAAASLPAETLVVPVPLAPRVEDLSGSAGGAAGTRQSAAEELQARALVAAAYGATHLFADADVLRGTGIDESRAGLVPAAPRGPGFHDERPQPIPSPPIREPPGEGGEDMAGTGLGPVRPMRTPAINTGRPDGAAPSGGGEASGGGEERTTGGAGGVYLPIPLVNPGEWRFDRAAEVWRPAELIEPGTGRGELTDAELAELLDRGDPVPEWFTTERVAGELRAARPPRHRRGLVVFFTGLSGSGKSTVARDLADALAERGDRTVSLLDGDRVRRLLSAGLTFSRADRDLNIARIGYVATEVARHGGIAICAPIAPYAAARAQARAMVTEVGDFLLVHVATPIEVCEQRDRKGLYAKARAGTIKSFTGVSDPYEEPDDADLVIDTSALTRTEAAGAVLGLLTSGGWLRGPSA